MHFQVKNFVLSPLIKNISNLDGFLLIFQCSNFLEKTENLFIPVCKCAMFQTEWKYGRDFFFTIIKIVVKLGNDEIL